MSFDSLPVAFALGPVSCPSVFIDAWLLCFCLPGKVPLVHCSSPPSVYSLCVPLGVNDKINSKHYMIVAQYSRKVNGERVKDLIKQLNAKVSFSARSAAVIDVQI